MVEFTADQFRATIAHADTGPAVSRMRRSAPEPNGAVVRIEITAYDVTTNGTYMGLTVRPEVPPAALIGPTTIRRPPRPAAPLPHPAADRGARGRSSASDPVD
jgi:hypothetical protein